MDTNLTETGGRLNRLFWESVEEAHKTGIFKYPLLFLLTLLFLIAFAIQLCAEGLLKLGYYISHFHNGHTEENPEQAGQKISARARNRAAALVVVVLLLVLVVVTVVPKIMPASGTPQTPANQLNGGASAGTSSASLASSSTSSSQSAKQTLWLDTHSCSIGTNGSYQFLLKSKVNGPVTVKPQSSSYVKVKLTDPADERGQLFTISGLKIGSAFITVESSGRTGSFPITVTKSSITIDTTSYVMPQSGVYDIKALLTGIDKEGQTQLSVCSSNSQIATVKKKAPNLYQVTGHKEGNCAIIFKIGSMSVSAQITVQADAQPHGDSTRVVDTL